MYTPTVAVSTACDTSTLIVPSTPSCAVAPGSVYVPACATVTSPPVNVISGAVWSTTSDNDPLAPLVFPATSVAVAVITCPPSLNVPLTKLYNPPVSTVAWPSDCPPALNSTVDPASATPLKVGVLSLVGDDTTTVGTPGDTVSTTNDTAPLAGLVFPAPSVAVAVNV